MRTPSRPSRPSEWLSSALAVAALLVFAGGGAWGYQQWEQQKVQDDLRTSQLIGCLEAAHVASDATTAMNACMHEYADRVPALRRSNPYAFVVPRTTASATPVIDAMSAAGPTTLRPTLSPVRAAEVRSGSEPGPGEGRPEKTPGGSAASSKQQPNAPAGHGKADKPRGAGTAHDAHPAHTPTPQSSNANAPATTPSGSSCNRHQRDLGLCDDPSARPGAPR